MHLPKSFARAWKSRISQRKLPRNKRSLRQIDSQTETLRKQLQHVQKQNTEIRQLIGVAEPASTRPCGRRRRGCAADRCRPLRRACRRSALRALARQRRIRCDAHSSRCTCSTSATLRDLARAQMIAAIPSIDPVDGAPVIGCFCYRTYPDVEFHPGVDLEADYGETVRASAAGTVVANAYDGGYGIKIDIDHGNGYHTWYAHLSRVDGRRRHARLQGRDDRPRRRDRLCNRAAPALSDHVRRLAGRSDAVPERRAGKCLSRAAVERTSP